MYETQFCTPEDCGHDDMGFMTLSTSAEQRFRQKKYATNIIIFRKVIFLSIKKRNFSCLENGIFSSLKFSQRPPEGGTTNGGCFPAFPVVRICQSEPSVTGRTGQPINCSRWIDKSPGPSWSAEMAGARRRFCSRPTAKNPATNMPSLRDFYHWRPVLLQTCRPHGAVFRYLFSL